MGKWHDEQKWQQTLNEWGGCLGDDGNVCSDAFQLSKKKNFIL